MSDSTHDRFYDLLPAIYRIRDAKEGEPLRALLRIIGEQAEAIEEDIAGLYDDWFIETCADWVIPYIGDLVGNKPIHDVRQLRRTDVAKTIDYRRRKGTAAMLEEMARDVTGWGAHVVEFFRLLGGTQHLNHRRCEVSANPDAASPNAVDRVGTVNLRSMDALDRRDGPFDIISHTVDVRPPCCTEGWYNIRTVGFFLWRLRHYPLTAVTPRPVKGHPHCYTFSRLGNRAPLFHKPHREEDETGLARELQVPGPIRPLAFALDLQAVRKEPPGTVVNGDYYGPERGLCVVKDGVPVPPEDVVCMDLRDGGRPESGKLAIDCARGLLSFAPGEEPAHPQDLGRFSVSYTYGFSADIGGGPYERRKDLADAPPAGPAGEGTVIDVAKGSAVDTLQQALAAWSSGGKSPCLIRLLDNGVYGGNVDIELPEDGWLAIQAANGVWPNVRLVGISHLGAATGTATLILDGLLIEGAFEVGGGLHLTLRHCTLVPGRMLTPAGEAAYPDRDSLTVTAASEELSVTVARSIIGPVRMPAEGKCLAISDSIVQAPLVAGKERFAVAADDGGEHPGPPTVIDRSTIFGQVYVKQLVRASEALFTSPVKTQRQQEGCVRFSYVPEGSLVPRRYRCQPDLALAREAERLDRDLTPREQDLVKARLQPHFTSRRYGDPWYAQLSRACPEEIATGAEDGAEMGVYAHLKQPQREANLRIRLAEYLPFGLAAGFIFVT